MRYRISYKRNKNANFYIWFLSAVRVSIISVNALLENVMCIVLETSSSINAYYMNVKL